MILLSHLQASDILAQFERGSQARSSLDLDRTAATVHLDGYMARLGEGESISLADLGRVAESRDSIFTVRSGAVEKLIRYSEATRRTYKLRPTADWPALEISGILMHRIAGTTPRRDAEAKLRLAGPVRGAVLDTCMGLGYTAILSAATATQVTAVEKDANVIEMARLNPWSREFFEVPAGRAAIRLLEGDAAEIVAGLADRGFDLVNHDPPTLSVAGELYSDAFYEELLRVLKPGGRLLHYVGAPGSKGRRVDLAASVARRLARIGFAEVRGDADTGCLLARRPGERWR